jgi:probable phosphoglycerate mutase
MDSLRPVVTLIRHGETAWSKTGQHTSRTDLDLTKVGQAQARALKSILIDRRFDHVLTSPLRRARRTVELAALDPAEVTPDLCEWDYGEFEGRTTEEIQAEFPGWSIWTGPWIGGERAEDVAARADRVINRIFEFAQEIDNPAAKVAVVAHGHILRVLTARWLGADATAGRWWTLHTATVSELGWEHTHRVLHRWNLSPSGTIGP